MKLNVNKKALQRTKQFYLAKWSIKGMIIGSLIIYGATRPSEEKEIVLIQQPEKQVEIDQHQENFENAYFHLNWITPSYGEVTINNELYNIRDIKKEYGQLYSFIEPLTEEEIYNRFEYLIWYTIIMNANEDYLENFEFFGGYQKNDMINKMGTYFQNYYLQVLKESNSPLLKQYQDMFIMNEDKSFNIALPKGIGSTDGNVFMNPDNTWDASIKDKEFMVRLFSYFYNCNMQAFENTPYEPEYFFELELRDNQKSL